MEYLALFVIAALSYQGNARSWRGYDYDYPVENHHNFNYNSWCHSAGGWGDGSWEDSSEESQFWNYNNNKMKSSTTTTTSRSVAITKTQSQGTSTISVRAASTGSTPSPIEILVCLRMCPITSEYNPVCGSDNNTYWNPGRLQCAITCGVNVRLSRPSVCPTTNLQPTTSTSSSTTTVSPQVLATCMRSCSVTSEYNPVCGTDNITYNNPSRLECARGCGKRVSVRLPSRCPSPDQVTPSTSTPRATSTTRTSTTTTTTTARPPNTTPSTSNVTPSRNSTLYTIASDILAAIFSGNITTTTEYIPDFSLDERYE